MGRIDDIFAALRADGRTALMPYVTAGHPSMAVTEATIPALERAGASIVELGIPFSDPIADGPVIAAAMHRALESGTTPEGILEMVRRIRPTTKLGLVAMVSCSIVDRLGGAAFIDAAVDAGIDGFIVPDADLDAAAGLYDACTARDVAFAMLVAPTTDAERLPRIVARCRGFVYVLARTGITGEREAAPEVAGRVADIRAHTDLPIACGFGISTADHVAAVTESADAAIVGSALVRRMDEDDPATVAERFTAGLARGLRTRTA